MCGFQWKIWDRIIIYISVEKSRAQNSSKTHSRPQRLLFLAHLIWTWTCLYPRFHMMQHTSRLPCEPLVSLLYHQRLSGCYRPNGNPPEASTVHMNQNSHRTCCSSWAEQLTTGCQSFPRTSQNVLSKRRGHCLRKFSQCKWSAIERKTKDILIPTPGDIIPPLFLPKGIQKGDSFKACLIISLDHRHGVLNHYGWNQHGHYTFIRKIMSLHFTLSGNFISKTKRVSKAMAPHSSTLAWKITWTEEPGRLQSMGSLRVGHDWATSLWLFTFVHWRRKWQPTPVFLPRESQEWGSLVGCCLWARTELDTTEAT